MSQKSTASESCSIAATNQYAHAVQCHIKSTIASVLNSSSTDGFTFVYSRSRAITRASRSTRSSLKTRSMRNSLFSRRFCPASEEVLVSAALPSMKMMSNGKEASRSTQNQKRMYSRAMTARRTSRCPRTRIAVTKFRPMSARKKRLKTISKPSEKARRSNPTRAGTITA
jgi:hypothetical protein